MTENDTLVLAGDRSWGRTLEECQEDFWFIMELPGRKILLRGNHDMFWDTNKTAKLNEHFAGKLEFLQDNFSTYQNCALGARLRRTWRSSWVSSIGTPTSRNCPPTLLREFVEKIVVHESTAEDSKRRGKLRRREIEIYYSFVGKVEPPES